MDQAARKQRRWKHVLGLILLASVVAMWTASSFIMQSMFGSDSYDKPFFVTFINTGTFILYLVPVGLRRWQSSKPSAQASEYGAIASTDTVVPTQESSLAPMTERETVRVAFYFCFIWFFANYFSNIALSYTNVASFTIISSMSSFFTLVFGSMVGVERLSLHKLAALSISLLGVIIVSVNDTINVSPGQDLPDQHPWWHVIVGDFYALIGAMLYGCYTVFLKYSLIDESRLSMSLFFGFVGLFNLSMLWPFLLIFNATGFEPFQLPFGHKIVGSVVINAAITCFSEYLWVLACLLTSPIIVTLGISMSIPLAVLGDFIINSHPVTMHLVLGTIFVFLGFVGVNYERRAEDDAAAQHIQ